MLIEIGDALDKFVDALDVFTSQYLSLTTAAYITFKFLHFRVFD